MSYFAPLVLVILPLVLAAAEDVGADGWPAVPDPVGLGPRLALIDWLRERKVPVPAEATDEHLVALWRKATGIDPEREAAQRAAEAEAEQARIERERRAEADRRRSEAAVAAAMEADRDRPQPVPVAVDPPPASAPATPAPTVARPASKPPPSEETPAPRIDNLRDWAANYGAASSSTRTGTTVTVYIRRGDTRNYWIHTETRVDAQTVRVWVDGVDYGTAKLGLRQVPAAKPIGMRPDLTLTAP